MKDNKEKRANKRQRFSAPIVFSYFNKEQCFEAQTLNHCDRGLCFNSDVCLKPGATVYIKVKNFHPNGSYTGVCEGLRTVTLGEVKWCTELNNIDVAGFRVGVKYYEVDY